jgi:hypothetical protein
VWGCIEFETRRNDWSQMPAAVQVSAAERVVFDQDVFAHLGQIALGIGNNADAHATGVGLRRAFDRINAACSPTLRAAPSWRAASAGTRTIRLSRRWQTAMLSSSTTGSAR